MSRSIITPSYKIKHILHLAFKRVLRYMRNYLKKKKYSQILVIKLE